MIRQAIVTYWGYLFVLSLLGRLWSSLLIDLLYAGNRQQGETLAAIGGLSSFIAVVTLISRCFVSL